MNNKVITAIAVLALGVVLFWPAGSSKKVENLYKEAEALYTKKDYEGAIGKYEAALDEATKPMVKTEVIDKDFYTCLLYTSPRPRDATLSRMPSSA